MDDSIDSSIDALIKKLCLPSLKSAAGFRHQTRQLKRREKKTARETQLSSLTRIKNVDKDARKKGSELTENLNPETEKPLKVGNISRFLKVNGVKNYKVIDK